MAAYNQRNKLLTPADLQTMLSCGGNTRLEPVDLAIYQRAFVHSSYCRENHQQPRRIRRQHRVPTSCVPLQEESNLGLEWLGDSVLQLVVTDVLMERHRTTTHKQDVGYLTNLRIDIINNASLGQLAQQLGLGAFLLIDSNLESNPAGGRMNTELLADCFEAFVGALYQDLGHQACKEWLKALLGDRLGPDAHPSSSDGGPATASSAALPRSLTRSLTFNAVENKFSDGSSLCWMVSRQSHTATLHEKPQLTDEHLNARVVTPEGLRVLILPPSTLNTLMLQLSDNELTVKMLMDQVCKYYQEHRNVELDLRCRGFHADDVICCRESGTINLFFRNLQPSQGHPSGVANLITAEPSPYYDQDDL